MREQQSGGMTWIWLMLVLLGPAACAQPQDGEALAWSEAEAPYDFERPDAFFELPKTLAEISGLTWLDDQHLGAVQDEEGRLYVLDLATGAVAQELQFGKKGDYEGIERAGDRLFVLRSDGVLFDVTGWPGAALDAREIDTGLKARCDAEGLAYDAPRERLLIACKEYAGKGLTHHRAIYAFDLAEETLVEEPAFVIDTQAFNATVRDPNAVNEAVRSFLAPVVDLSGFKPSGLALHPVTGQLYVLSSVRKAIVVLNPDGSGAAAWALPEHLFIQPEGLVFLPGGDLLLSSEGDKGQQAVLARFTYRK